MRKTLLYRTRYLVPSGIRRSRIWIGACNWLRRCQHGHDGVYDQDYYQTHVEPTAVRGAMIMADSIMEKLHPKNLIDVGCGTGALLEVFQKHGVKVKGLEYSEAALVFCRARQLDVSKFDLMADDVGSSEIYDVGVSLEVAEHLPAKVAEKYVDMLTRLAQTIVFTAATPGQGGLDHVNEQPPAYWIEKFATRGFILNADCTKALSENWRASGLVASWYFNNLLIFEKR